MRKILASILIMSLLLISSTITFAASTDFYLGDGSTTYTATENTYTLDVYLTPTSDMITYRDEYGVSGLALTLNATNGTVSLSDDAKLTGLTNATNGNKISFSDGTYTTYTEEPIRLSTATITREGEAESTVITFSGLELYDNAMYDYTASLPASITINWPASEPAEETKAATVNETVINAGGKDWTWDDAKAYTVSATGFTKTTVTEMSCALTLAEGKVKTITVPGTFSNATVSFRALVVGIPEGTTLSPTATVTVK